MAKKKQKRLLYLTACYPAEYKSNLENDLSEAYDNLEKINDRTFQFAGKTWTGLYCQKEEDFFAFQFAISVPGESASILPQNNITDSSIEMGTTPPPDGHDFSDGDAICLVSGNKVFACLSGIRDYTITIFLRNLFQLAQMENAASVEVMKITNYDKLRLIKKKRIKSIQTTVVLGGPEFSRLNQAEQGGLWHRMWSAFSQADIKLAQAAEKSHSKMRVMFSGSRRIEGYEIDWLTQMGEQVLEYDHSYRIELENGTVLTPQDILITKRVSMSPNGKSVFIKDAIHYLKNFKESILD